jgi:hypothetical protein
MGGGVAYVAVVTVRRHAMALVDVVLIPVGAATTVPPTSGWAGFDRSVHEELQAYENAV